MKRITFGVTLGLLIGLLVGTVSIAAANTPIKLLINGNYIQCDVPPQNINGRVLVPARFVAEALGANVSWDDVNQTVIINEEGYTPPANSLDKVQDQVPVRIEELPVHINIKKPDSIGTVYMEATYKNNSNKNIVGYQITVLLKDTNEKTYLSNFDTILPGETSPKFETFGPKTRNKEDMLLLKYDITILNDDGEKTYLTYDTKLKNYEWF